MYKTASIGNNRKSFIIFNICFSSAQVVSCRNCYNSKFSQIFKKLHQKTKKITADAPTGSKTLSGKSFADGERTHTHIGFARHLKRSARNRNQRPTFYQNRIIMLAKNRRCFSYFECVTIKRRYYYVKAFVLRVR